MAVRIVAHTQARPAHQPVVGLPPVALAIALIPSALDLLQIVQPALIAALAGPAAWASGLAAAVLAGVWLRYPRATWLLAASFAACASLALRLVAAELGPLLSLLSIIALGVGGAFATSEISPVDASP
jgi:hypothetical protein